jgi:hypothetical protein
LGCGAFKNDPQIIVDILAKNIEFIKKSGLDITIVGYNTDNKYIQDLTNRVVKKIGGDVKILDKSKVSGDNLTYDYYQSPSQLLAARPVSNPLLISRLPKPNNDLKQDEKSSNTNNKQNQRKPKWTCETCDDLKDGNDSYICSKCSLSQIGGGKKFKFRLL